MIRTLFQIRFPLNPCKKFTLFFSTQSRPFNDDLLPNEFSIDEQFFRDEQNQKRILDNIRARDLCKEYSQLFENNLSKDHLGERLIKIAKNLPNDFHPFWNDCKQEIQIIQHVGTKQEFDYKPLRAEDILKEMDLVHFSDKISRFCGSRSYMFLGQLSKLAQVLARWTMNKLVNEYNFTPVITPNLIYADFIRACGFEPFGPRNQVYTLAKRDNICLSGTAEIPLASLNLGENFPNEKCLPKRYCALSRCYRAEARSSSELSGLYRVHYFDKVEMFGLTEAEEGKSDQLLNEFVSIEKTLFEQLGLYFRVLDMPPIELGQPAYRKFDIEAYMPGRDIWGEISSASNCTDYQSKRLNITYNKFYFDENNRDIIEVKKYYVHTVNGTACAIPRTIIALVEQYQTKNLHFITIPKVLHSYMKCDKIEKNP